MNIKPQYVTFEQARLLKEKGFNLPVTRYYRSDGKLVVNFEDSSSEREYHFDADDFFDNWNNGWSVHKDGGSCFGCKVDEKIYFTPYSCPEVWQVIEWLKMKHNLWITVSPILGLWFYYTTDTSTSKVTAQSGHFQSSQETYSVAITHVLTNLI